MGSPRRAANTCSPHRSAPASGNGQVVEGEPPHVGALERVRLELAADRPALEDQRVERDPTHPHPEAVEHGDEADHLDLDAGLLLDLLGHHLGAPSSPRRPNRSGRARRPESARWTSRISPLSLPTAAPTATLGVT